MNIFSEAFRGQPRTARSGSSKLTEADALKSAPACSAFTIGASIITHNILGGFLIIIVENPWLVTCTGGSHFYVLSDAAHGSRTVEGCTPCYHGSTRQLKPKLRLTCCSVSENSRAPSSMVSFQLRSTD